MRLDARFVRYLGHKKGHKKVLGNIMRRVRKKNQRRQWGNILERENGNGEVTSLLARYQSPFGPGRITKSFPPTDAGWKKAAEWLEDELAYLERCEREHKPWNSPKQREALRAKSRVTFGEFVEQWLEDYRTKSGEELSGSSKWNIRADVGHLLPGSRIWRYRR